MTEALQSLMIVNDPQIAAYVSTQGVDRLFVDLEVMGKSARQGHLDSVQSAAVPADITLIREAAPDAHLLVRINPLHDGSKVEIEEAIARGADSLMLPMFRDTTTLAKFFDLLAGRAEALPLFETAGALAALPEILEHLPLTCLHIGLNDLSLDLGCPFMFEPLISGVLEAPAAMLRAAGLPFGMGGIARAGEGAVPPERLLGEHVRLGSNAVILSRTFHRRARSLEELKAGMDFAAELHRLRALYSRFLVADDDELEQNRRETAALIAREAAAR